MYLYIIKLLHVDYIGIRPIRLYIKCMYVCMCIYVCICICICMCTCMCMCMCMYVCVCMYMHVCMSMYVCMYLYVYVCPQLNPWESNHFEAVPPYSIIDYYRS